MTYSNRVAAYPTPSTSDGVCSSTGFVSFKTDFLAALDLSHMYVSTSHSNNNINGHFIWCAFKAHWSILESQETENYIIKFSTHAGASGKLQKGKWTFRVMTVCMLILYVQTKKGDNLGLWNDEPNKD